MCRCRCPVLPALCDLTIKLDPANEIQLHSSVISEEKLFCVINAVLDDRHGKQSFE